MKNQPHSSLEIEEFRENLNEIRAEFDIKVNGYHVQEWTDGTWTINGTKVKDEFAKLDIILSVIQQSTTENHE